MQKSILITGCSSGIGLAAALALHKRGYQVFASTRKTSDVEKLRKQGLESLQLDVTDPQSIKTALALILEKTAGKLDILFNNGGYIQPGAVEDLSLEMLQAQFATNFFGIFELTNQVIPIMRKQGHGRIIQNSSILGIITMPYRGAYNASKFALEGLSATLRQELRGTNIFVSCIRPGPIRSQLRNNTQKIYHETVAKKSSVHAERYEKMKRYFMPEPNKKFSFTLGPDAVVKQLLRACESTRPKTHYYVGFPAHLFSVLRRLLPEYALDWVIAKIAQKEIE